MTRWLVGGWAAALALLLVVTLASVLSDGGAPPGWPPAASGGSLVENDDRAEAIGSLLDVPAAFGTIDQGLEIAERLRLRYGIDTGDRRADRLEAARRAQLELVADLVFSREEIERTARDLGYDLNPSECSGYCENVERLAVARLRQRALKSFAQGGPMTARSQVPAVTP